MVFNITSGPTATAQFPSPIFIDTEGSTSNMNVNRMDKPTSWQMLIDEVNYIKQTQMCDTLVLDTADWAETLANQAVIASDINAQSIEDFGYGKGYTMVKEKFGKLLNLLSELTEIGINVVITAHADIKKFEKPDEMGAFDRYQLKLSKQCAPLLKEWADMLLFANYETTIVTDSKTKSKKATGGQRVMFTTHHPAWDAKNRHGLPDKLPFEFGAIAHVFQTQVASPVQPHPPVEQPQQEQVTAAATVETPQENNFGREPNIIDPAIPKELAQLMSVNEVTEEEIRRLVAEKGFRPYEMPVKDYPDDLIQGGLVAQWDKIFTEIKAKRAY